MAVIYGFKENNMQMTKLAANPVVSDRASSEYIGK